MPAKSVFTPVFIDALRYGKGDLNKDGYVTGVELGFYLQSTVPQHARQTPQFGKISDYKLARGDFVFAVGDEDSQVSPPAPVSPTPVLKSDGDGDGVADNLDKCPDNTSVEIAKGVYKSGSSRGCPIESDSDKVPDFRDHCPHNRSEELAQGVDDRGCPLDSDGDGVADYRDKCSGNQSKEISAGVDSQGCPLDTDGDSVADYRDSCSQNTSKELSKGVDSRGCPLDTDRDGVADYRDSCLRNKSKEIAQGVDQRGCPIDKDQDKVADYRDSCLGTSAGVKVKENGCPVPKTIVSRPSSYRYSDNGDGTVTDNRSGLIWLKNANCFGKQKLKIAMQSAANLADGQCGLRDGSRRGDWRLPTLHRSLYIRKQNKKAISVHAMITSTEDFDMSVLLNPTQISSLKPTHHIQTIVVPIFVHISVKTVFVFATEFSNVSIHIIIRLKTFILETYLHTRHRFSNRDSPPIDRVIWLRGRYCAHLRAPIEIHQRAKKGLKFANWRRYCSP
ncbi:thrombospondin type 3 repeat-containing OmpA/MotB protein [Candidatus Thiomargarita nelsonii]|uniref:Thrombospondin type 3 repeat-containing OmpA/MotB protein n=1 Tax=Candidatus Thiomargarita nelsonii TaxID=1003181 RepID=A0A176RUF1_9GAMM|nr:thrombospondin type 3 repeat-containing OmpA/MotB protein [Candidatus Thiomargarita nelsonii]